MARSARPSLRRSRSSAAIALFAIVTLVLSLASRASRAQPVPPIRTWGAEPVSSAAPASSAAPGNSSSAAPSGAEAPPPPPVTIGTPVGEQRPSAPPHSASPSSAEAPASSTAPPEPDASEPSDGESASPIVRTPRKIGLRYFLEGVEVRGNTTTLARVVLRYVHFRAGDTLDVDDPELELTRFRLLGTGFFRDVQLSLRRGSRRGYVVLVVTVAERNTIVVNDVWLGLSADAEPNGAARPLTAYGGIDIAETNLAGTGITLGGAVAVADRQLGLRARFIDPQFLSTSWAIEAGVLYNNARDFFGNRDVLVDDPTQTTAQDFAVVSYRRFGGLLGAGHDLGISTRFFVDYRLETIDATFPLAASHRRGLDVVPIDFDIHRGDSVLSTVRGTLVHDTRDEPFLPTRGVLLHLTTEASLTPLGSDYPYTKLQVRAARFTPLPWGHVLELEGFGGAIFGGAPLFEKFYVGDFTDLLPDRVLDLNFDRRAPPNFLGTDIEEVRYGSYAAKLSSRYRLPLYRGTRAVYGIDLFGAAGVYGVANEIDLTRPARGYTGFSRVPIDLTFNLGLQIETAAGGFTFGVSSLLGFLPVRQEARP